VTRRRDRAFCLQQKVRGHVLDSLERADGAAELIAGLRVVDRKLEASPCAARLLSSQAHERHADRGLGSGPCRAVQPSAMGAVEFDTGLRSYYGLSAEATLRREII